jgi:hypothetical protein
MIDRALKDVSNLKISDLYEAPFGQKIPLKSRFLMKIRVFRRDFLPRCHFVCGFLFIFWKYYLWAITL